MADGLRTGHKVEVNGLALNYELEGAGLPLVLVHGTIGTVGLWDEMMPFLRPKRTVLKVDLRGCGASDPAPEQPTSAQYASDVAQLMSVVGIDRAPVLGHSAGGSWAMQLALDHPQLVTGVIVAGGAARWHESIRPAFEARIAMAREQGMEAVAQAGVAAAFPAGQVNQALADRYLDLARAVPVDGYVANTVALLDVDLTDRIGDITQPTLVLVGAEDAVCPTDQARETAERLPNGELDVLDGVGHASIWEAPELVVDHVLGFLDHHGI